MILGVYTISGHSMLPHFQPSEKVLASSLFYLVSKPKVGDVILFKKDGKTIIKRIIKVENNTIKVLGDNKNDSLYNINLNRNDIIGKVFLKI